MGKIIECSFAEYCKSVFGYCFRECNCESKLFQIDLDCTSCFRCVNDKAEAIAKKRPDGNILFCDECHRPAHKVKKAVGGKYLCKHCYLKTNHSEELPEDVYTRPFDVFAVTEKEGW